MNPDPGAGHKSPETWLARLRSVLTLGHARIATLTGQQTGKTSASFAGVEVFPFSFTLGAVDQNVLDHHRGMLRFSLGGFLCFLLSLSLLCYDY
jgi:hypothetical protein